MIGVHFVAWNKNMFINNTTDVHKNNIKYNFQDSTNLVNLILHWRHKNLKQSLKPYAIGTLSLTARHESMDRNSSVTSQTSDPRTEKELAVQLQQEGAHADVWDHLLCLKTQ